MTNAELHNLINKYFDGETSIEEERALRHALAFPPDDTQATDKLADEARAVMGFSIASAQRHIAHRRPHTTPIKLWRNIAAAAIAVIAVGALFIGNMSTGNDECVAYLNGHKIADRDVVMAMMQANLNEIGDASSNLDADITGNFNEIANIMDSLD